MNLLQLNAYIEGSTGDICKAIHKEFIKRKLGNSIIVYARGKKDVNGIKCSNTVIGKISGLKSRLFGTYGFNAKFNSIKFIVIAKKFKPDILQIHNVHDHSFDIEIILKYAYRKRIKVLWTLHDCWPFTGYCSHYSSIGCEQWKNKCEKCPIYKNYI